MAVGDSIGGDRGEKQQRRLRFRVRTMVSGDVRTSSGDSRRVSAVTPKFSGDSSDQINLVGFGSVRDEPVSVQFSLARVTTRVSGQVADSVQVTALGASPVQI